MNRCGWLAILFLSAHAVAAPLAAESPTQALLEGNRLFRAGSFEAAFDAFSGGWDPARPDPVLAYNLGATLHRLERLPEALLWYRRAEHDLGRDPWWIDNVRAARETLDAPPVPPPLRDRLARHRRWGEGAAIILAWAALLSSRRSPRAVRRTLAGAGLAILLFGAARLAPRWSPIPAVLLTACAGSSGELPAGTETWIEPRTGGWWVHDGAGGRLCPRTAATPVR